MDTAIVTGGARGLGRTITEGLLRKGFKVCVFDVKVEAGRAAVKEMANQFGEENVVFQECDVTSESNFTDSWNFCEEKLGIPNVLVNNAGIGDEIDWRKTINVNLVAIVQNSLYALEKMSKENGGNGGIVLNIGSIAGLSPLAHVPTYTATKHGVVGITRALGHPILAERTGVNFLCLCPSLFESAFLLDTLETPFDVKLQAQCMEKMGDFTFLKIHVVQEAAMKLLDENKPGAVMAIIDEETGPFYVDMMSIIPTKFDTLE